MNERLIRFRGMKAASDWTTRRRKLRSSKRSFQFPTPLALLKDDLDVLLKLFISGSGIAAFFLLIYFHSIGFSDAFLPAISSPQVLLAFFSGGAFFAVYLSFVFLLPVFMINPSYKEIADVYMKLGISTWQQICALLAFPLAMLLTYFTPELLPTLVMLLALQLIIVRIRIKEKVSPSIAGQWVFVAFYWWFGALFLSFPMLVILKWAGEWSDARQWFSLFGYAAVLAVALSFVKRVGWKVFILIPSALIVVVPFWENDFVVSGAARFLGVRHEQMGWYWVASKVIPTSLLEMDSKKDGDDKGCYLKAMTPFSTADIHILCKAKESINRANCILTLDKSDAKTVTNFDAYLEQKSKERISNICILPFGMTDDKTVATDSIHQS